MLFSLKSHLVLCRQRDATACIPPNRMPYKFQPPACVRMVATWAQTCSCSALKSLNVSSSIVTLTVQCKPASIQLIKIESSRTDETTSCSATLSTCLEVLALCWPRRCALGSFSLLASWDVFLASLASDAQLANELQPLFPPFSKTCYAGYRCTDEGHVNNIISKANRGRDNSVGNYAPDLFELPLKLITQSL